MNRWIDRLLAGLAFALVLGLGAIWAYPAARPEPHLAMPPPLPPLSPLPPPAPTTSEEPPPPRQPTQPGSTLFPCPGPRPPAHVSVLTFNIHGALSHTGYHLDRIAQEIEAWDADVVLLQEVDRHRARTAYDDQPAELAARLDLNVAYGSNVVWPPAAPGRQEQEYGTAILTRFPIHSRGNVALPNRAGLEQRGLLRVTLRMAGEWVDVYGTHLQHTRGNIRIEQMRAIRDLVADDPRPHLLGGDLNAAPDSPTLAIAGGFVSDPWPGVGEGPGLTVPAHVPHRRIDYVLHSEDWVPTAATTLLSDVSDHRALRVDFDLPLPHRCR